MTELPHLSQSSSDEALVLAAIGYELASARAKWPAMNSPHEAYAVILEELDEFWIEVKRKQTEHDPRAMYEELIQVAAMAARATLDCGLLHPRERSSDEN